MIFESWPWRTDLIRDAEVLRRWVDRPFSPRRDFLVEKKIFTSAYVMRKLLESEKLSSDQSFRKVPCKIYPCTKRPTVWDRWEWYEHYDMNKPNTDAITVPNLLNLIIHSLIFTEFVTEYGKSASFLVTTDQRREKGLWDIRFDDFIELIVAVAKDNPSAGVRRYDPDKRDWISWRGHGDPPEDF